MPLHPSSYRNRAVLALHRILGGDPRDLSAGSGIPAALHLPDTNLIVCAGDHEIPLDVTRLRPLALKQGCSVLATYVDPFVSGHRFVFDVVLAAVGDAVLYPEYRLWLSDDGRAALISEGGKDPAIDLTFSRPRLASEPPYPNSVARQTGIARAQSLLHGLIYRGTPFATPLDQNIGR